MPHHTAVFHAIVLFPCINALENFQALVVAALTEPPQPALPHISPAAPTGSAVVGEVEEEVPQAGLVADGWKSHLPKPPARKEKTEKKSGGEKEEEEEKKKSYSYVCMYW